MAPEARTHAEDRPGSAPAPSARFLFLAPWIAAGLLVPGLDAYLRLAYNAIRSDLELDYGEGTVLWQAQNLPHLEKAVHPFGSYPYILFNYTPVYHCVLHLVAWTGLSLQTAGRLVSVLSFLATMLLAALVVKRASRGGLAVACGVIAGLLITNLPNAWWSVLVRVDTLAILFVFLGLTLFAFDVSRAPRGETLGYAAFLCFVIALYTRQTLIAAPTACLIYLSLGARRRALRHAIVFAVTGSAILITLGVLTHGEWPRHLFRYNVSPLGWRHGVWLILDQFRRSAPILLLATVEAAATIRGFLARSGRSASVRERVALLFTIYFAVTAVFSLSIMKDGANVNYLMEFLFAACVLAGLCVLRLMNNACDGKRMQVSLGLVSLMVLASTAWFARMGAPSVQVPAAGSGLANAHQRLLARLTEISGDVYSEEMTALIQAGKEVPAEPSSVTFLNTMHLWDETPLVERILGSRFAAIVVTTSIENRGRFSPRVSAAIKQRYRLQEKIGPYRLYFPIARTAQSIPESHGDTQ
jgi:hypothetical protein